MGRFLTAVGMAMLVFGANSVGWAADAKDATAILDKAIKALGGEEKLSKMKAFSWKGKGTITFGGNDNPFSTHATVQGLDHFRQEIEGEFGGNAIKFVTVLAGDKAWRKFGDNGMELDKDQVANEKRTVYLAVVPITLLPLKSKAFKTEAIGEEKVDGKAAAGIKATGPDGKDFRIYFDSQTGLPVKMVAKVLDFMGNEFTQETTFHDYKEMAGIQKATKLQAKRDGEKFLEQQVLELKVLDKVDPKTFAEPQ